MWNENKVTEILHIKYPIIQAGMAGGITTPTLVAAVSEAGCLGTIGAGYMTAEQLRESVKRVKQLTNKPFGVNLFVPEFPEVSIEEINQAKDWLRPFQEELNILGDMVLQQTHTAQFEEQIKVIIEEGVSVCSFTFGLPPKEVIQQLKEKQVTVIGTATTVEEAVLNEEIGMDLVVMQGSEAGGHRGTFSGSFEEGMIGTTALIPQTADYIRIPIIAAGGIMDGRGVLSTLLLGAQAVQMGTAFVVSLESGANDQHKAAILASKEVQPVVTSVFSGKPARGIRNAFISEMEKHEKSLPNYPIQHMLTSAIRKEAAKQNRAEWMSLWCGQSPLLSKSLSADQIITQIISQIEKIIKHKVNNW